MDFKDLRIAVLVADEFEDVELTEPVQRFRDEGAQVTLVGLDPGQTYEGKKGETVQSDKGIDEVSAGDFDALYIPGGKQPEHLRMSQQMIEFVREMDRQGKWMIAMCHGPQVWASAELLEGRRITSWPALEDDMINAGASWVDEPVVVDGRYISSRKPDDIPQLLDRIVKELSQAEVPA